MRIEWNYYFIDASNVVANCIKAKMIENRRIKDLQQKTEGVNEWKIERKRGKEFVNYVFNRYSNIIKFIMAPQQKKQYLWYAVTMKSI